MHVSNRCYIQPIEEEAPPQQQDDSFDDPMKEALYDQGRAVERPRKRRPHF